MTGVQVNGGLGVRRRRAEARGFTLVELLIALVLTALILSLLFVGLRISSRAWDSADQRQQAVTEQYQLQQLLRRLIGQARGERVRHVGGGVQVAFHGEAEQVIFLAPQNLSDPRGGLLWYRLRLQGMSADQAGALVLDTRLFDPDIQVDWNLLFDPTYMVDEFGNELPPPKQHRLRELDAARLRFSYFYYEMGQVGQTRDEWQEEGRLPLLVELSLEEGAIESSDSAQARTEVLLPSWTALAIAMQEYSHEVRRDGL